MTPPIAYRTVVGQYLAPDGTPIVGVVRFIPSVTVLDSADNVVVPPVPLFRTLDGTGSFTIDLAVTDDPSSAPNGWLWILTEEFAGGRTAHTFQLPIASPSTVALADLLPATSVDTTYSYASQAALAALDARLLSVESSAAVVVAAVVIHPMLTMGA